MNMTEDRRAADVTALRADLDRLKADLREARGDIGMLARDTARVAQDGACGACDRVKDTARAAAAKGKEASEELQKQVATHPFAALAAALAVGVVAGLLVARKD